MRQRTNDVSKEVLETYYLQESTYRDVSGCKQKYLKAIVLLKENNRKVWFTKPQSGCRCLLKGAKEAADC